jgi:hypothetical protein
MKRFLLLLISLVSANYSFAQIPIAIQGFESGDNWSYTASPEFYNFGNGDVFGIIEGEYQGMSATTGSNFLALHDLANPNVVEGETSSYYHYMTFSTLMIPQPSPEDLKLSFKYLSHEFDGSDYMAYELQFDDSDNWYSAWDNSVDTTYEFSEYLQKDTDGEWILHTIDIPDTVSYIRFRIGGYQNGGGDWAGIDDIFLYFDSEGDFIPPNVTDASIITDQQIILTFDELVQSATALVEGYDIQSSSLNSEGTQLTINLTSSLVDGDFFTISTEATDIAGNPNTITTENLVHNDFIGDLVITEINYNDPGPYDNLDFIEIYNNGDEAYPLGGLVFNAGVNINFTEYTLEAGEYIIVAQPAYFLNDACGSLTYGCGFQSYFGFAPDFEIASGYLGTGTLTCVNTVGETVITVDFDDSGDWPTGVFNGYSIVLCDPSSDMNDPLNWELSSSIQYAVNPEESVLSAMGLSGYTQYNADPGAPCPAGDVLPPVVINIYAADAQTVVVVYDEAISVDGTYDGIEVSSSTISGDTVTLTLSTPLVLGSAYPVTISGTEDAAGNAMQGYGVDLFYNTVSNLFFSEYAEGSGSNKYLEIYNASETTVDLSFYALANTSNAPTDSGIYEYWSQFPDSSFVAPGEVFIVADGNADSLIASQTDWVKSYLSNGDDGYALVFGSEPSSPVDPETGGYIIVDFIGDWNGDPGSGWEVAGEPSATKDHTLVRKCSVEGGNDDWLASAGTSAEDSEWLVLENDDWSNLGQHETPCPDIIFGCTDESASNFNSTATEDDGSCIYLGCTDETATNYDPIAQTDDGSCIYPLEPAVNLFFSEYAEGSSNNKYLEIYNPTSDTVSLQNYGFPSVGNAPDNGEGIYEYWNDFPSNAVILPNDVYVIAHPDADASILAYADTTHTYLSNGDDGYALVYGYEPITPTDPETGGYVILDFIGDWNGDPGSGWDVAGESDATKDRTLVRKCSVEEGNDDWLASAGTSAEDSEWLVYDQDTWTYLGSHTSPCDASTVFGCTDTNADNYNADATDDDGSCTYPLVDVTVSVDMNIEGFESGSVWDGLDGTTMAIRLDGGSWMAMSDADTDGVWEYTFSGVYAFIEHTYNFNDGWYESGENLGDCAGGAFGNDRTFTATEDLVVPTVCWESCTPCPQVLGCIDASASNYNPDAVEDDGSCEYDCIDPNLIDPNVFCIEIFDPVCGCDEVTYTNSCFAEASGVLSWTSGECNSTIAGCTDELASNYNPNAVEDDGSCIYPPAPMQNLFFSEYAEGSSNNKYLEIYNPSSETVDLSDYAFPSTSNAPDVPGEYEYWNTFDEGAQIAPNGLYIIAHPSSDPYILDFADMTHLYLSNGDDGYALAYGTAEDYVLIDMIGDFNADPGSGWDVAGVASGTKDHTLVRKCSVVEGNSDWTSSAGTTADDSEWIVLDQNDWTNLGAHSTPCSDADLGCTDEAACNFDANATENDGSCTYPEEGYDCQGNCLYGDLDGDDICDCEEMVTLIVDCGCEFTAPYTYTVYFTNVDEENCTIEEDCYCECINDTDGDGICDENEILGCTDVNAVNYDASSTDDDGSCCYVDTDEDGICDDDEIQGCTDPNADNYDPNAGLDDGSCTFCGDFTAVIFTTTDATTIGGSNGNVQATGQGGSSNYDVNVFDADGILQNPFALSAGVYTVAVTDITSNCISELEFTIGEPAGADPCDVVPSGLSVDNVIHNRITFNWSSTDAAPSHYMIRYRVVGTTDWTVISAGPINTTAFSGTSRTRYFMEPGTTYEWSMRARVLNEDLTINCQSDWSANSEYTTLPACPNLDNLSVSTEASWVTFFADAPSEEWGVWQSKGKMRELGTNSYRYVNGDSEGNINGLKGNFTASTDYEWHTKAWCTGNVDEDGNSDPMYHSGWGDFSAFSTEAACDKMPMNLTTSSNGANTAVIMSWDTPESGAPDHYFLEMTNGTTGAVYEWNDIPGTATSQTKFNQNPGDEISWRIRGACGTNGTSWATIFSQPVTYTLGGERVAADLVSGLDVYPNPSRDIFNISFSTKTSQTVNVQVVNLLGEEVYTEELVDFEGYHQTLVDMNGKPKGVYFLEITTLNGSINQKIVLQ